MQKISVIIITKNDEGFVCEILDKLVLQDNNFFEVIIADRCSTDNTLTLVRNYPVKIVRLDSVCDGLGEAINFGISNSIGEIIFILSGNTVPISNKYISSGIRAFETKSVFLSFGDVSNETQKSFLGVFRKPIFKSLGGRRIIAPNEIKNVDLHSFVVRKSDWLNNPIPEKNLKNYWQWLAKMLKSDKKIFFEPRLGVKTLGKNKKNIFLKTGVNRQFKDFLRKESNDLFN